MAMPCRSAAAMLTAGSLLPGILLYLTERLQRLTFLSELATSTSVTDSWHDEGTHTTLTVCSAASPSAMTHMFDHGAIVAEISFICFLYVCLIPTDRLPAHWD